MTNLQKVMSLALTGTVSADQLRRYTKCILAIDSDTPSAWACSCDCRSHNSKPGGWCPGSSSDWVPAGHQVDAEIEAFIAAYAMNGG